MLSRFLDANELDAVVMNSYENVSLFADTDIITQMHIPERLAFLIAYRTPSSATCKTTLIVCNLELRQVLAQTNCPDVRTYVEFADQPADFLVSMLRGLGLTGGRIGIEGTRLPANCFLTLATALPGAELVMIDEPLQIRRAIKSAAQIEALGSAANTTLRAILESAAQFRVGDTERSMARGIADRISDTGGKMSFTFFAAGPRSLEAHPEATASQPSLGELWRADVGVTFGAGVRSDVARCGIVGPASERQRAAFQTLRASYTAGVKAMFPGNAAGEVYRAVHQSLNANGVILKDPHVGHGIGFATHEYPILEPNNDARLEPGMTLCFEPVVEVEEWGECYHTEDLILMTEDGPWFVTQPQEALIEIGG